MASIAFVFVTGVLVQHGIKVTCEKTGNFKSTLQKSYRSVAFLLNNCKLPNDEVWSFCNGVFLKNKNPGILSLIKFVLPAFVFHKTFEFFINFYYYCKEISKVN